MIRSDHPYYERFVDIMSDPYNEMIPRVVNAGMRADGIVIMHNGLKVYEGCYYDTFSDIFHLNKGVHEPAEEYHFAQVIKTLGEYPTMIEVGAYWGFYSMCLLKERPLAKCVLIEPDEFNMEVGRRNFELNGLSGQFIHGSHVDVGISEPLDILHVDIQGWEVELIKAVDLSFVTHLFISTHSQESHYQCVNLLSSTHTIIFSADIVETYCHDGIIVCTAKQDRTIG